MYLLRERERERARERERERERDRERERERERESERRGEWKELFKSEKHILVHTETACHTSIREVKPRFI